MATFDEARATLPPPLCAGLEGCLAAWAADAEWRQVGENIRSECALPSGDFASLLLDFAGRLAGAGDDLACQQAWRDACARHEFRGAEVPGGLRPPTLGRAWSVHGLARAISRANPDLDADTAARDLRRHLNTSPPPAHVREHLRSAALGGSLIWATFDPADPTRDPFLALPPTASGVRSALGLGFHRAGEPIVALIYRSAAPEHGLPLHRPTVADANSYCYYRPHPDPGSTWGYTLPLAPGLGVAPAPEIVHKQITGSALIGHRLLP